jgi:hypothetical protein
MGRPVALLGLEHAIGPAPDLALVDTAPPNFIAADEGSERLRRF